MPKTIRNQFDNALTYENLVKAHNKSRKGKNYRENRIYEKVVKTYRDNIIQYV